MPTVNNFEGVPWMIDKAVHSADVGRLVANLATGNAEGIAAPGDCKVSVSGGKIHIAPGATAIRNRSANVKSQSYAARNKDVSSLDIPATGANAASYLVVATIRDPQFSPWSPYPAGDPRIKAGPYAVPELIQCGPGVTHVKSLNLSQSMYAYARYDIPPNQAANAGVGTLVDCRRLVTPYQWRDVMSAATPTGALLQRRPSDASTNWFLWPGWNPVIAIPERANNVQVSIDIAGVGGSTQPIDGELRGRLRSNNVDFQVSGSLRVDLDPGSVGGGERHHFMVTVGGFIPEAFRGTSMQVFLEGWIAAGSPGQVGTNPGSHMKIDVQFDERTV